MVWHPFSKVLSIWSRKACSTVTTCKIYCIYRGTDILTFHSYTVFSWKSLKCNLRHTDALPDLRAQIRETDAAARMRRAHTHLSALAHSSASMGDRTIFRVNNSPLCVSNAKEICQNQRTCPKGRNSFDQYEAHFAVLFLNTVWNRKGTRTHMAFNLDFSALIVFGRLLIYFSA